MLNKRILVLIFLLIFLPLVGCFPGPSNETPIITSAPITTATVGVAYTYDVNATDPDDDILTYSLLTKPDGMTINATTGVINWKPTFVQVGDNAVTVGVSDEDLSVTQSFTIKVSKPTPTPVPPPVNHAPSITSSPITTAIVGVGYVYDVEATDPDGDVLTYSLTGILGDMTIGSATGKITWIPKSTGSYNVTVKASDGKLSDTQSFTITVSAVELTSIVVVPKTMTLLVGETENIVSVTAHYSDGSTFVIDQLGYDYGSGSSDETIATVDVSGLVTAVAKGTTIITVGYVDKTDTIEVTVGAIRLTSIVVLPETMLFSGGQSSQTIESVTAHYNNSTKAEIDLDACDYESSDKDVATVSDGVVTPVDVGTTTITVSYTEEEITKAVLVKETDTIEVTVGPVHNITANRYYYTITEAITDALSGDIIEVAAGTYEENVNIDESVTLRGEDRETTEIKFGYDSYPSEPPLTISADGVTVSGFTIHSGPYIETPGAWTIAIGGDNALLTDLNVIKETCLHQFGGNPTNKGAAIGYIVPNIVGFTFTDSTVDSAWNGLYTREGSSNIIVQNVDFTCPGENVIFIKSITSATIEGNGITFTEHITGENRGQYGVTITRNSDNIDIIDNQFVGSDPLVVNHIGILLQAYPAVGTMGGVTILNNDISSFSTGILVEDVDTSGISVHDNNIYNNLSYGLNYLGSDTVNAENNWWGDESGPTHSSNLGGTGDIVSDNVDFSPFSESPH